MTEELENRAGQDVINPGELLRSERERVGFSETEVASHLNLSKSTLTYLEAGRFDRLPGDTFTRGYIRSYARLLKLDPNVLAAHYDRYVGRKSGETRVAPISRVEIEERRSGRWIMRLATMLIVAGMLALGLWWWSEGRESGLGVSNDEAQVLIDEVQVDSMTLSEPLSAMLDEKPLETMPEHSGEFTSDESQDALSSDEVESNGEQASSEVDAQPVAESDTAPAAPAAPAAPVTEELQQNAQETATAEAPVQTDTVTQGLIMAFSANCWVQVSTPAGRVLHSEQMSAGQTLTIDQQGPLDLVIGAASAVSSIEYNGQPVTLNANRQSGVARLRLGQ